MSGVRDDCSKRLVKIKVVSVLVGVKMNFSNFCLGKKGTETRSRKFLTKLKI